MKTYRYIGSGAGVAGLPHTVSDEEAEALGVTALLAEAVAAGLYEETEAAVATETELTKKGKRRA